MGTSFLFPGTHSRLDALKKGTKDGVKMVIGLVPIFIIAAFFEGYVTRHYKMPIFFSISILLLSLAFLIGYFIIYPIRLSRRIALEKTQEEI